MKIITDIQTMQEQSIVLKNQGESIGFVPTMGALHEGHLSLVRQSKEENDNTIVSIFVNPLQFGPNEDLNRYPRPIEKDTEKLNELGVDFLFLPSHEDLYPDHYNSYVIVDELSQYLCGMSRPGHFRGVTTIVAKLFHISLPSIAYFGQKDYQQVLLIRRMVQDLNFPLTIKTMPIIRDMDGLAMSSRNAYLSYAERQAALRLNESLKLIEKFIGDGEKNITYLRKIIEGHLLSSELIKIDYISICNPETLKELESPETNQILIALAVFIGKTRLIDNSLIRVS